KRSDHSPSARAQSDVTINISIIIRRSRRCTAADARKMASSPASLTSPARSARETDHILGVGVIHLEIRTHTIHFPDRRTIVMPSPRHELTETASVDSKIPHHERAKLPLSNQALDVFSRVHTGFGVVVVGGGDLLAVGDDDGADDREVDMASGRRCAGER
ncbi:unnamed protein product, partial [Ixodes pacificus]